MFTVIVTITVLVVLFIFINNKRNEMNKQLEKNKEIDVRDKIIVITGANAGLGKELALRLAKRGARIIMACRTERKARDAVAEIIKQSGNQNVEYMLLDLLSLDSINAFAKAYRARDIPCHMLVCNAGIMWLKEDLVNQPPITKPTSTEHSFNTQFLANYLGHFLLTIQLFDVLMKSNARVLNISSSVHKLSSMKLQNLTGNHAQTFITYCQSKLAQIYSTYELERRVDAYSAEHPGEPRLHINAVHPGIFASEIVDLPFPLKNLYHAVFKSAAYCSEFIIDVLVGQKFEGVGGKYFDHGKIASSSSVSYDTSVSSQLYTQSLDLLSTHFNLDDQNNLTKLILK